MGELFRSCRRWIILYAVLATLAAAVCWLRFPVLPIAIIAGLAIAIPLWFGVAYILGAVAFQGAEAKLIRKGREGGRPQDGEQIAVCGTVSSGFETLEAPFSRRRAVAYEYKIVPMARQQATTLEGFALAPMTIDGPRGSIRILAYPELVFAFESIDDRRRVEEYVARTEWTDQASVDVAGQIAFMKNILADDDGRIRFDIRRRALNDVDLSRMRFQEKVIAPGDKVCAIGTYSSSRNALVPHTKELRHSVRIFKGDVDEVLGKTRATGFGHIFLGLGCLIPLIAAVLAILALVPLDAIEQMKPQKDPSWTEVRVEKWIERNVRRRFEFLRPSGDVAILLEDGQARGRLNDVHLTKAKATRDGELTLTTDDGSQGVIIRFADKSARVINGPTISVEVEQLSQNERELIGRVSYLSKDLNLRVAFHAIKP